MSLKSEKTVFSFSFFSLGKSVEKKSVKAADTEDAASVSLHPLIIWRFHTVTLWPFSFQRGNPQLEL